MSKLQRQDAGSLEDRVHAFRKLGKKVRAYLKLCRCERDSEIRGLRCRVSEAARVLSAIRDRHVAIRTAKRIHTGDEGMTVCESSLRSLQEYIDSESSVMMREEPLMQESLSMACNRIESVQRDWTGLSESTKRDDVIQRFMRSYRQGRNRTEEILRRMPDIERFHDLRKAAKQWGYQAGWLLHAELVEASDRFETMVARCDSLGDELGDGLDLERLSEQLEYGCRGNSADSAPTPRLQHVESSLIEQIQSEGMRRLIASAAIASQLYFASPKSMSRWLVDAKVG